MTRRPADIGNDRAPSHRKPKFNAHDLAARIAAGETLADLAAEYQRTAVTLTQRLNQAGFSAHTGLARVKVVALPTPIFEPRRAREWLDDALCARTDPEAFFPEKGGSTQEAKAMCKTCPVRLPCLEDALLNEERFGVLGGLSERERRRLLKTRRAAS